jgi:hypothetical protein
MHDYYSFECSCSFVIELLCWGATPWVVAGGHCSSSELLTVLLRLYVCVCSRWVPGSNLGRLLDLNSSQLTLMRVFVIFFGLCR